MISRVDVNMNKISCKLNMNPNLMNANKKIYLIDVDIEVNDCANCKRLVA